MAEIKEQIEDKIIDCITMGAGGRLVVFKPENLDKDLVVEKRNDYKKKVIFLNIYRKEEVKRLVAGKDFIPQEYFYLVFVDFDAIKQEIGDEFWVVPALDSSGLMGKGSFSDFLVNKKDFAMFLFEKI